MPLFSKTNNRLMPVSEKKISLEKDIQTLTEDNIETVFGYKFVSHEFALNNLRIDTLAFDEETNSFVIIEYKRDRSFSVVDQGFAYLALMLNNKADFVLEYNEKMNKQLKRVDIDWSQSKVIFIAHSFTQYQRDAISFKDLRFELWEVKKYDNGTYLYNQITADKTSESINKITNNDTVQKVSREVKNYTIDDHFKPNWVESRALFDELREKILALDDRIVESPQKYYIGYKIGNKIVVAIKGFKSAIDLELLRVEPNDLKDIENKLVYQKNSMKYYNKHISVLHIHNTEEIDYGVYLSKQVVSKFFN